VQTVAETLPGFEMAVWYAAYGPAGLPPPIVARLNAEIGRILLLPEVKKQMVDMVIEVAKSSPDELAELTRADAAKWTRIIKQLGVAAE
jgi:tripartite-type tricarboxylate transporter receptor subunit TctC